MTPEDFNSLIKNLEGLDYFFISGFAVHVYTSGVRSFNDIDIVVSSKDIGLFAKRIGCIVNHRLIDKGSFMVDDLGFEGKIGDQEIEVTSGYPKNRVVNKTIDKLFAKKIKKSYRGKTIFLAPIEEIIAYKALTFREKDIRDLILLRSQNYSKSELKEIILDLNEEDKIIANLKQAGYSII